MTTPYVEELALVSKNNEGISEIITLTTPVNGVSVPVDLSDREFFAQARSGKTRSADLLCEITVTVLGDPTEGKILLTVAEEVMSTISPVKGHYDLLTRSGTGLIDNLYMAPFIVENGVSDFSQWQ